MGCCFMIILAGLASAHAESRRTIILPEVKIKDVTLEEAVAYLKQVVKKLDGWDDANINVIILGASEEQKRKKISLDVREIPLRSALDHIALSVGMKVRVDAHAVILAPATQSDEILTRTYRVPPHFIQAGSAAK
jgi:hypothetical protein